MDFFFVVAAIAIILVVILPITIIVGALVVAGAIDLFDLLKRHLPGAKARRIKRNIDRQRRNKPRVDPQAWIEQENRMRKNAGLYSLSKKQEKKRYSS